MRKSEYDFRTWTSFPSSLKFTTDEAKWAWRGIWTPSIPVKPGAISVEINVKKSKVLYPSGVVVVHGWNGSTWRQLEWLKLPLGSYDWTPNSFPVAIPEDVSAIRIALAGGGTTNPAEPAETWLDDLRVYQDGVLIYENKLTAPLVESAIVVASAITGALAVMWGLS